MAVLEALGSVFPPERLKLSLVDRVAFANDAGFYHLIPIAVVQPVDELEISTLFILAGKYQTPLVFRAAGTSLSGQSITDGILVDISKHWRKAWPLQNGHLVKVQPGIIGGQVNTLLKKHGRKIGPDPASINSAMMGGILANNASGMCCGVAHNSYHTLKSIRFMLPNGVVYDTGNADDYERFLHDDAALAESLLSLQQQLHQHPELQEKIRRKYRMKNTVGYSLNALLDYRHPLDILAHLLIGSEGTLGFIAEAVLQTLPDLPFKSAAMLYFPGIYEACSAIDALKASGAEALELMDRNALRSVEDLKGLPDFFRELPEGAAALLCEYQSDNAETLAALLQQAEGLCASLPLLHKAFFVHTEAERAFYWKIRKGMFPSVGAVRQRGSTVILEDIAIPTHQLANAIEDLKLLFTEFDYANAIIFGHAKEGNIHFVITQLLDNAAEVDRYDRFMRKVVALVLEKYEGALKAEHGTGRNMAPFVEAEWGGVAYAIMQQLKAVIDPQNVLNPGVIINTDAAAHIKNLKQMPQVEEEVDKCIECGFCEHHCPSRDVTLTPRQRIQVRRQLKQYEVQHNHKDYKTLLYQYQYSGLDTCATDGLCQLDCPVAINTGELVKRLRHEQHGSTANKIAMQVAKHFGLAEKAVKFALHTGTFMNRLFGSKFMPKLTRLMQKAIKQMPQWWNELSAPPKPLKSLPEKPDVVYLSACIQRMMGNDPKEGSVQQAMLDVCLRAGINVLLPKKLAGHCCGQAFSSKGYFEAAKVRQRALIDALWQWTDRGRIPVVCDFTSCTYTLLESIKSLETNYIEKLNTLKIIDSIEFLQQSVVPQLPQITPKEKVVLHPGCAATKMYLVGAMQQVGSQCAKEAIIPADAGCCGMAGDRGFLFPELTKGATLGEIQEASLLHADGHYASAKTCEMALTHFSGNTYNHLVYLVRDVSEPFNAAKNI